MASQDNKRVIRIESILGGHAPTTHFAASNQFRSSLGIDPALPWDDDYSPDGSGNATSMISSGLLRPVSVRNLSTTSAISGYPLWFKDNPKLATKLYVYTSNGSVYSITNLAAPSGLGDLNDGGTAAGNGAEYYDNYMYFARNTTVARYGPLNGTPAFTDDYWVTTLSKTALSNTEYPAEILSAEQYPNHVLHRHSDGRLYIADVVDNKGTIHYIETTKTTVEGDTDNGSTYNKVQVGYGLWPTAMESYGSDLVIAFHEGTADGSQGNSQNAKIAFWDTTSQNVNKLTWVEFPDNLVSGMKNINGVLYVFSGSPWAGGFRISRFIGGYTFEEVYFSENGVPPFPGAIDGEGKRLLFGSYTNTPEYAACVYSFNLHKNISNNGVFNVFRATTDDDTVTAIKLWEDSFSSAKSSLIKDLVVGNTGKSIDITDSASYQYAPSVWWSQTYRIGQPFKITAVKIGLAQAISTNHILTAKIYLDNDRSGQSPYVLQTINNTNYSGKNRIVLRNDSAGDAILGQNHFWLELKWTGSSLLTVELPITIEYELIDE